MSREIFVLGAMVCLLAVCAQASYWRDTMQAERRYTANHYMQRMSLKSNVSALPSGILVVIDKRGHGDVAPAADDVCEMHYTASYRYHVEYDSTRGNPYPVRRRPSQMVPGVKMAMELMREGDIWTIYVPYQLAYGEDGNASAGIASYTNLMYEVELFKCPGASGKKSDEIDAYLKQHLKVPIPPKTPEIDYTIL